FFSSRRRHTRCLSDWSSDVCSSDLVNWYYFADRSPVLRFSLRYDVVVALGVLGLWLDRRNAARHRLLWYFLIATVGGLMYGTIEIGRASCRERREGRWVVAAVMQGA